MFKKEIKFIYDFNLNEVKKLGNYITYEQLLSANLHPAILQYISADIDYLIFEDRQKILRNSVFDYSGEKVHQYFSLIGEEIRRTKRFSIDYMSKLILHASSFTVNFVSRPRWALLKFIFDDENHKNTTEVKQILNYLYYYGHLQRIVTSYINRKKILSVNEKEFEELLYRIDMLSVDSNSRSVVQSSLKSMADFFNIGDYSGNATIPLKAVELFLAEKELNAHIEKLRKVFGEEDRRIGLIDCLKTLDQVMYSKVDIVDNEASTPGLEKEIESETPFEAEEEISLLQNGIADSGNNKLPENIDESTTDEIDAQNVIIESQPAEMALKEVQNDIMEENNDVNDYIEPAITEKTEILNEEAETQPDIKNRTDEQETKDELFVKPEEESDELLLFDFEKPETSRQKIDFDTLQKKSEEKITPISADVKPEQKKELATENSKPDEPTNQQSADEETEEIDFLSKENEIEISRILENKSLAKVIEIIFDYDIEDFASTIEKACKQKDIEAGLNYLEEVFKKNLVETNSKEADALRSVIVKFFNQKR